MNIPSHKERTEHFRKLTYAEQAKSINAETINLEAAVRAHICKAREESGLKGKRRDPIATRDKCIKQIERMAARLKRLS